MTGLRKIRIVCSCGTGPEPWRVGFILETGHRSPVGTGCSMIRNADGVGTGYLLGCGRCPRSKTITFHNWRKLVAGLDADDAETLDIAALPF